MINGKKMLSVHRDDDGVPDLGDQHFRLVLYLHIRSSEDLGIDTLGQPGENVPPRRPDGDTEVERSRYREQHVEDNVPQIRVQEEKDEVREEHETKENLRLVLA
jgi:hypothetical protein